MTGGDQIAVPAQHGLRTHQRPHTTQNVAVKPVEPGRQEGPVGWSEPDLVTLAVELPFEDRDLVVEEPTSPRRRLGRRSGRSPQHR